MNGEVKVNLHCTCGPERFEKGDPRHAPGCPVGDWLGGRRAKQELSPIAQFGAEQLAKLFHETYERLAPNLPKLNKTVMLVTCEEVLRKLEGAGQNEPLTMLVSKHEDKIRIDFTKKIGWMSLEKQHAINFAITILQHCGVPVNITLNPPPAASSGEPI